jgi:hypothetical protein
MTARAAIKVQPRASRDAVAGRLGEEWKIRIQAPPIEGRANDACIGFFARALGVPRSAVRIVAGASGRHKRIEIDGVDQQTLDRFLQGAP